MHRLKIPRSLQFLGVGLVVFALFAMVVGVAGAQQGPAPGQPSQPGVAGGGQRGQLRDDFLHALATNLGLSTDTVRNALQQTRQQMQPEIQQRRQELRDRMRQRSGNGGQGDQGQNGQGTPRRPVRPGFGAQGGLPAGGPVLQNVADILKMSVEDVRTQLQQGKTLAQISQDAGVSPDSLADQLTQRAVQAFQSNQQQLHDRIRQSLDRQLPMPAPGRVRVSNRRMAPRLSPKARRA